jgi:hypothetical protein
VCCCWLVRGSRKASSRPRAPEAAGAGGDEPWPWEAHEEAGRARSRRHVPDAEAQLRPRSSSRWMDLGLKA